ncbi:uncharacterized protein LOC127578985 [Pristis pectinata]|uniref:uncharacterized protein LOC127578985 n=1 Tax=Pristis pectinata TaxID=685728 RepID=UPI00223D2F89|nr:uncharacterized protein LOC127578985 [Pristis pectinata]
MPEAEAGKSRGDGKRARRKKEQQEPEAEGESRPPPLPPAGTETTPASYVIEWLCAQPAAGPAEDPPSFHDVYHRHDAERPPSAAAASSSSRGQRNGLDSYAQTIRYCGGQERPEEPVRLERGPREGGPAAVSGRPGITVAVGDRTVVSRPQPRRAIGCRRSPGQPAGAGGPQAGRAIGCRRSPGQPAGEGGPQAGRAIGCRRSPGQPAGESGPQAGRAIGCRRSPGQPAGECCPQAVRADAAAYAGIADVTAGACAGIADVTARAHTERREPEPGARLSPARGPGSPGPSPERGRKPQDAAPGRQKTTTPTTEPRRAATSTGDSGPGDGPRLPGGAEVPRRISGGQLPALGNENQDVGGEDLMHQPLGKRLSRAGADKDIHLSGASVPLDKMSTGEVSKWLTDSSFQSCVQRAIGNQCKAIEQQTEEPWAVKDRCSSCGTEKEADTCGAAKSLERMTTEEVCKWLTDSGFETYVPYIREFGITGRQLANTDSELFDQLQLQGAEDRERLLFALYQELNPSDMNVEEILGGTDIDNVFSSVELPTDRPGSEDRISGEHLLQANSSYIILEDSAVESMIKNSPVDISYAHQPQQLAPDTPSKLLPSPPAVPEQDQMPLLDQRVLELSQVVEDGLREAGRQVQECDLRKPVDPVLMKDRLGCIQAMMEEVEDNILQIELRQRSCSWEDRNPAKASGEGTALELHLIQQKLALIQLMQQFSQAGKHSSM